MSRNTVLGACVSAFKLPIKVPECSRSSTMPVENYGKDGDSLLDYIKLRCHFGIPYIATEEKKKGEKKGCGNERKGGPHLWGCAF